MKNVFDIKKIEYHMQNAFYKRRIWNLSNEEKRDK